MCLLAAPRGAPALGALGAIGIDLNQQDAAGRTPLHVAASEVGRGAMQELSELLGADEKYVIDPTAVVIERSHFINALSVLTPAAHRALSARSAPLSQLAQADFALTIGTARVPPTSRRRARSGGEGEGKGRSGARARAGGASVRARSAANANVAPQLQHLYDRLRAARRLLCGWHDRVQVRRPAHG